jgi:Zn-finger protein
MEKAEIIKRMRGRVEQCRRLAASTTDERTAEVLRQIAGEGEADIRRLLAEPD